ncbi:sugar phosphate isomerase/epimerase family protein [Loktanella sp. S4079]|uniref:sugar phosphate isomerase/epimerase family protein n=1 Tax=Loktanella sp. S4079 TaxID=579483 RepID=UPI0005FA0BFE|nr:sugar phosphate isomerase/epimerase [Loktanella sp. S4079]KJZ18517.1 endonuclease [Loktanella sp. S4079]
MTRQISVAHLTAVDLSPPRFISEAAEAGFDAVGLRLIRVTQDSPGYPLMRDPVMMRDTQAALRDTGLMVNDIEFVKLEPQSDVDRLVPFLDAGASLGAREVICAPYDMDLSRLADRLGRLSELAMQRGLNVSLEFFPWTVVPDLMAAHRVACAAGPEVGVLVDALHFDRSESTIDQLRSMPAARLRLAHLCDAPVRDSYSDAELLHTARAARLPPGEGQIDLGQIIAALPAQVSIGVEVPMTEATQDQGYSKTLKRTLRATKAMLDRVDQHMPSGSS